MTTNRVPSEIVYNSIDSDYPVAGQDNDSQGFRDNFRIIQDAIATASAELTDLRVKTARLDEDNDFNGSVIFNAKTNNLYGTVFGGIGNITTPSGKLVSFIEGQYQLIRVTGNHVISFTGWPETGSYARILLELSNTNVGTDYTVTFGGSTFKPVGGTTTSIVIPGSSTDSTIVEVWTTDGGVNVYLAVLATVEPTFAIGGLNTLTDVTINDPVTDQILKFDGENWINSPDIIFSGSYLDLTDKPTIPTDTNQLANTAGFITTAQLSGYATEIYVNSQGFLSSVSWNDVEDKPIFASVATSGSYDDLLDKPTIPEDLSDLTDTTSLLIDINDWNGEAELIDTGAVDLTKSAAYFTTAAAETATLAAGSEGQTITLAAVDVTLGNMVITASNAAWGGAGTVTFSTSGQACTLQYINNKWFCVGNNGAIFA
jgi:hypothetical protein